MSGDAAVNHVGGDPRCLNRQRRREKEMKRKVLVSVWLVSAVILFGAVSKAGAILIGGGLWSHDFDDTAFVDEIIDKEVNGFYWEGGSDAGLLNGDVGDGGVALLDGDYISFIFTDNTVLNGAGADLAVFEAGLPAEDLIVSVSPFDDNTGWTTTLKYDSTYTGAEAAGGYNLNVALIDLSDFGFAEGDAISAVKIFGISSVYKCCGRGGKGGMGGGSKTVKDPYKKKCCKSIGGTDLVAIGSLNREVPVPEPGTLLLIGTGLVGLGLMNRKLKG